VTAKSISESVLLLAAGRIAMALCIPLILFLYGLINSNMDLKINAVEARIAPKIAVLEGNKEDNLRWQKDVQEQLRDIRQSQLEISKTLSAIAAQGRMQRQ
jgi:hypothetical protein